MKNSFKRQVSWIQGGRISSMPDWIRRNPKAFRLLYEFADRSRRVEADIEYNGKVIHLKAREFITGRISTSERTGLSEQEYKTLYKKFEKLNYIETSKVTSNCTIGKYLADGIFFNNPTSDQPTTEPANQPTTHQRVTTNKNEKEINKNVTEIPASKKGFFPCSDQELYDIALSLEIPISAVLAKHAQILDMAISGEMLNRYPRNKETLPTLKSWLNGDLAKNYIQPLDEIGLLVLKGLDPKSPNRKEIEAKKSQMIKEGNL